MVGAESVLERVPGLHVIVVESGHVVTLGPVEKQVAIVICEPLLPVEVSNDPAAGDGNAVLSFTAAAAASLRRIKTGVEVAGFLV